MGRPVPIEVDGVTYSSLTAAGRVLNMAPDTVKRVYIDGFREQDREATRTYQKQYARKKRDHLNKLVSERNRDRYQNDIIYRERMKLRHRTYWLSFREPVVYLITSIESGRRYIGSTINLKLRVYLHRGMLKRCKHHSKLMQEDYNRLGWKNFLVDIIAVLKPGDVLVEQEQLYIDSMLPEYNSYSAIQIEKRKKEKV